MPVYERFDFLEMTLFSILAQEHQDWELVIKDAGEKRAIDDARIGKIFELVGSNRLRYAHGHDGGVFYGFNDAMRRARGDVVNFMCSDDLLCPGALGAVFRAFEGERYPSTAWLYGRTVATRVDGRETGVDGEETTYEKLLVKNRIGLNSVFIGRGMLGLTGGFDVRYRHSADYDLYLRMWRHRPPSFLGERLGVFRHHERQLSDVNRIALESEARRIGQRHRTLADVVIAARNVFEARRAYADDEIPWSVN